MIENVFNAGRIELLPEFFAPAMEAEAGGLHQLLTAAFPDLRVRIEDPIAEDDKVAARLMFTGTHLGPFRDLLPPSARSASARSGSIRWRTGR